MNLELADERKTKFESMVREVEAGKKFILKIPIVLEGVDAITFQGLFFSTNCPTMEEYATHTFKLGLSLATMSFLTQAEQENKSQTEGGKHASL